LERAAFASLRFCTHRITGDTRNTRKDTIVSRMRAILEVTVREHPYPLTAVSSGVLAVSGGSPIEVVVPVALLLCLRVRVRFLR
jgi:hypothetical protein